ncbi:MAG: hypothetical protein AAF696_07875 [Bacteroidota bacterium]
MAKSIPKHIKEEVTAIIDQFNLKHQVNFQISFRGAFAYLSKIEEDNSSDFMDLLAQAMGINNPPKKIKQETQYLETKIGRLAFNTSMKDWGFAVYKYSRDNYDPNEWMFPGADLLDGTIEGALRAAPHIYP